MTTKQTLTAARQGLAALTHLCRPAGDLHAALPAVARHLRSQAIRTLAALDALLDLPEDELSAIDALDDVYTLAPATAGKVGGA